MTFRRAAALLLVPAALVTGCGTRSADLFVVHRTGSIPGARLTLVLGDGGTVRCNGGGEKPISSKQLLDAREILHQLQSAHPTNRDSSDTHDGPLSRKLNLPARPGSVLRYDVRAEDGSVRFADNSLHQPPVYFRIALFVRQIAQGVCGLPR